MKMIEMETPCGTIKTALYRRWYDSDKKSEIVLRGYCPIREGEPFNYFDTLSYTIVTYGRFPAAYVKIPKKYVKAINDNLPSLESENFPRISWNTDYYPMRIVTEPILEGEWVIGWAYDYHSDFKAYPSCYGVNHLERGNHIYTLEEVLGDVEKVCNIIKSICIQYLSPLTLKKVKVTKYKHAKNRYLRSNSARDKVSESDKLIANLKGELEKFNLDDRIKKCALENCRNLPLV